MTSIQRPGSVQTSVKILGETEDNEKLIFSLDSGHNVWELGARQPELVINYLDYDRARCSALVVVDTNPGKRGWRREIIFRVLLPSVPRNPSFDE